MTKTDELAEVRELVQDTVAKMRGVLAGVDGRAAHLRAEYAKWDHRVQMWNKPDDRERRDAAAAALTVVQQNASILRQSIHDLETQLRRVEEVAA